MTPKVIDKRKLIEHCFDVVCKLDKQGDNIAADALKKHILWYLVDAESIDAVPVVRCRECKYHNKPPCPMRLSFNWTEDDDFCSYGERKEGDD